ncbi:hypothetical protein ACTFIV_000424 [Dictyostelium citrinum]
MVIDPSKKIKAHQLIKHPLFNNNDDEFYNDNKECFDFIDKKEEIYIERDNKIHNGSHPSSSESSSESHNLQSSEKCKANIKTTLNVFWFTYHHLLKPLKSQQITEEIYSYLKLIKEFYSNAFSETMAKLSKLLYVSLVKTIYQIPKNLKLLNI